MSFDFYAIAPHRLDVSSVQSLGNDVAHRLHAYFVLFARRTGDTGNAVKVLPQSIRLQLANVVCTHYLICWLYTVYFTQISVFFFKNYSNTAIIL